MKVAQMPPVPAANPVANNGNTKYGVDVIDRQSSLFPIMACFTDAYMHLGLNEFLRLHPCDVTDPQQHDAFLLTLINLSSSMNKYSYAQ